MHSEKENSASDTRPFLQRRILESAYIETAKSEDVTLNPNGSEPGWFFDFRRILFEKEVLSAVGEHFWAAIGRDRHIQIGGLETAALPIIAACVLAGDGVATGFYIRKSRKKKMQMKQIEGVLSDADIVLVDDLMNTSSTFRKQVEILEGEGKHVSDIFVLVRFREMSEYAYFTERNIRIHSLFTLDELGVGPLSQPRVPPDLLEQLWYFGPAKPHLFDVRSKPQPIVHNGTLLTVSDSGYVWCLDMRTGKEQWSRRLALRIRPTTSTFTSPVLHGDDLFVGLTNGTITRLTADQGTLRCIDSVAERLTSGLIVAPSANLLICGISTGGSPRRYAVAAFDSEMLEKRWEYHMEAQVVAKPLIEGDLIIVADVQGNMVALDVITGTLRWSHTTHSGVMGTPALYGAAALVFGTEDGSLHVINRIHGKEISRFSIGEWLYATPCVISDRAYVSALDSRIYCVDLKGGAVLWKFETKGRVFASPVVKDGVVYVGNNDGKLFMLNAETGDLLGSHLVTERITNPVIFADDKLLVTTFANEVYCLKKR